MGEDYNRTWPPGGDAGGPFRLERDLLGERLVPAAAYWGIHTLRAVENFPISGQPLSQAPDLIRSLAAIKQAAARANHDLGSLDVERCRTITAACEEIAAGALHDQFVVDLVQGGAGTSTNMNANEVIANRALELAGRARGDYLHLHPNEHVNMSQSTNDVYPSAVRLAAWYGTTRLLEALAALQAAFARKGEEFVDVVKLGRTQLQDAVPMTVGQEFGAFARLVADGMTRLQQARDRLCMVNLGGTAIGTGITAHPGYGERVCRHLAEITGLPVTLAPDLVAATQDCSDFVALSGTVKQVALTLSKICNDLRLLSSGPRAGLNEIDLPARQAGSSIMPGKVNPVIPEVVNQVAFEVMGNDLTLSLAAEAGQLQLNAFEPVIFSSLHRSLSHLAAACITLERHCVREITVNRDRMRTMVEESVGLITMLNPFLGYEGTTRIALEAHRTGRSVYDLTLESGLMTREQLDSLLTPEAMTANSPR